MSFVDLWAVVAAFVGCAAIGIRRMMLKPELVTWSPAPWPVRAGLVLLAIVLGMTGCSIIAGQHADPRLAVLLTAEAVVGVVMAWNLYRNGRAPADPEILKPCRDAS